MRQKCVYTLHGCCLQISSAKHGESEGIFLSTILLNALFKTIKTNHGNKRILRQAAAHAHA
jgi:hypothetical protein